MNKLKNKILNSVTSTLLLMVVSVLPLSLNANQALDQIAAVVNDDVIMFSEIKKRAQILGQTTEEYRKLPRNALLSEALENLIMEKLQLQQAEERGIEIDSVTLNKTLERIAKKNNLSLGQFRVALQNEGINYNDYREQIRSRLIMEALRARQVDKRIRISNQEVEDLIVSQSLELNQGTQYLLQHILISAPSGTPVAQVNAAKNKAEIVRKSILAGAEFEQSAKTYSDNYAAENGGNLGWQAAEKLPASFNRVLSLLDVGAISDVVRDPKGFHILKLLDKKGGKQKQQIVSKAHVKHILVKVDQSRNNETALKEITSIKKQLDSGSDFAQLATQYSEDPGSAAKGGDLGWVSSNEVVPQFANVMTRQPLNVVSSPFRTQFGWHVLLVSERGKDDQTDDALKAKAREYLGQRRLEEEYEAWLQRLKSEAFIDYRVSLGNQPRLRN